MKTMPITERVRAENTLRERLVLEEIMIRKNKKWYDEKVPCTVEILKDSTGEVREHGDFIYYFDGDPGICIWEEGNYSCDCHRAIVFGDPDESCGESRFKVNIKLADKTTYIYREFDNG